MCTQYTNIICTNRKSQSRKKCSNCLVPKSRDGLRLMLAQKSILRILLDYIALSGLRKTSPRTKMQLTKNCQWYAPSQRQLASSKELEREPWNRRKSVTHRKNRKINNSEVMPELHSIESNVSSCYALIYKHELIASALKSCYIVNLKKKKKLDKDWNEEDISFVGSSLEGFCFALVVAVTCRFCFAHCSSLLLRTHSWGES